MVRSFEVDSLVAVLVVMNPFQEEAAVEMAADRVGYFAGTQKIFRSE